MMQLRLMLCGLLAVLGSGCESNGSDDSGAQPVADAGETSDGGGGGDASVPAAEAGDADGGPTDAGWSPGPMTLVGFRDAVSRGLLCNDGTPGGYYFRRGAPASRLWVLYLQGGGSCNSVADCDERATTMRSLMTSSGWPASRSGDGIQSPSVTDNPDFADANQVYVPYCSSDLHSGDREASVDTGGRHFRGARMFDAVVDALSDTGVTPAPDLADATDVVLAGGSAGGIGVLAHLDRLAATLSGARVRGLCDAGWSVDMPGYDPPLDPRVREQDGFTLWAGRPDSSCVAANAGTEGACYLGSVAWPFLSSPLFVHLDQRDAVQLSLRGLALPLDAAERAYAADFAAHVRSEMGALPAAFSPAGTNHTLSRDAGFWSVLVSGSSLRDVFGNWFFDRSGPVKLIE